MKKRGEGEVIAIIVIILVVFAAFILVWNVVKMTVSEKSSDIGTDKFSVDLLTRVTNLSSNPILVQVTKESGWGNISAIKIIFKNAEGSSWEYLNTTLIPGDLETVVYVINRTKIVDSIGDPVSFEVYPVIITDSGKEIIGTKATSSGGGSPSGGGTIPPGGGTEPSTIIQLSNCGILNETGRTYVLTEDIAVSGSCFNITARNVTLDLNGHKIEGDDTYPDYSYGVFSDQNFTTIKNGTISKFGRGIYLAGNSNNQLTGISASSNSQIGVWLQTSSSNVLKNVIANSNDGGIYLEESSNNNTLSDITANSNDGGIYLLTSSNNILNNITANSNSIDGIYLLTSSKNTLTNIAANSNDDGIYLEESSNNILTTITANDNSHGIVLFSSSDNNILTDVTANSNTYGIGLASSSNNQLTGITANSNYWYGLYLYQSSNNNQLTDVTANLNTYFGIYLASSPNNNTLSDITANSNSFYGIILVSSSNNILNNIKANSNTNSGIILVSSSNNNVFTNVNEWNCSSSRYYACIYTYGSSNANLFENVYLNYTTNSGRGIWIRSNSAENSKDNFFKNVVMENIDGNTTRVEVSGGSALNNTFLNATYNINKESVTGSSAELIRKWYYQVYVNDTSGNSVSGANITAYNVFGAFNFNLTTGSSGYSQLGEIIDYINTGTRAYYSLYNIYAIKSGYLAQNHNFNASLENNYKDVFMLTES